MRLYVLGLREKGGQTDQAVSYRTASKTVTEMDTWLAEGGVIAVILRAGQPIDSKTLRRDARKEDERQPKTSKSMRTP